MERISNRDRQEKMVSFLKKQCKEDEEVDFDWDSWQRGLHCEDPVIIKKRPVNVSPMLATFFPSIDYSSLTYEQKVANNNAKNLLSFFGPRMSDQ
jgi:hypothetical protein